MAGRDLRGRSKAAELVTFTTSMNIKNQSDNNSANKKTTDSGIEVEAIYTSDSLKGFDDKIFLDPNLQQSLLYFHLGPKQLQTQTHS